MPDINLPDSVNNEPGSHGYVQFRLKRKAGLPVGTIISNKAYIYFDYNPAIVTNTVSATLTLPVGLHNVMEENNSCIIYPNPSDGLFNVYFGKNIEHGFIELLSMPGERIYAEEILNKTATEIHLENIANGIYMLRFFDGKNYHLKKFIFNRY